MSAKLCQGPICHEHKTKDRIRGPKGDKHYETRKRSHFYYNGNFVLQVAKMIGSEYLAHEPLIISVEYMSLKEQRLMVHGIRVIVGAVMVMIFITLLMIYLVNAYQSRNNNTKMIT